MHLLGHQPQPPETMGHAPVLKPERLATGDPRAQRVLAEGPGISARGFQVATPHSGRGAVSGTAQMLGPPKQQASLPGAGKASGPSIPQRQ